MLLPALLLLSAAAVDPAVVDKLARESMQRWNAPGVAIAIVDPTRTVYQQGYGVKTLGKPADPVTPRTVFAIASTTKAFTAALIGMLVDEGKLDWDDPVRKHLPEFRLSDPAASELVTVRDLLSHRTGLARNDSLWYGSPWNREELLDRAGRLKLAQPFRSTWQYQNLMFLAAGQVAVAASGAKSWEDLVQQRIVGPLGMSSTTYSTYDAVRGADVASPHAKRQGKVTRIPWLNLDNIAPAGSMNSNVEDLALWVRAQLNDGKPLALSPQTLREMHTPQMHMRPSQWGRNFTDETNQMTYGLGWFLQDFRGEHVISHSGAIDGFRAQITLMPKQKLGIIVLANLGSENMPEALRWKIVDHILHTASPKDWDRFLIERGAKAAAAEKFDPKKIPDTTPSLPLTSYVGDYTEPAYGIARVSRNGKGALEVEWAARRTVLEHLHYDTFAIRGGALEGLITFRLNAKGEVESMRFQDQDFARTAPPFDPAAVAQRLVNALKLGKGEKVIVRYDPDYLQGLAKPIEDAVRAAGGIVAATLPYAAKTKEPAIAGCSEFVKLLEDANVYFWMPFREESREVTSCETRALVRWLDAGGAHREIHFHWNGGSVLADGLPASAHPLEYDRLYANALDIDYAALSAAQDRAIRAFRAGTVRVTTPAGTHIEFRTGSRPFNKQDGDASAERMKTAKVRVDREIEFPAGVLRVAPMEETANGVIVIPEARFGADVARNIRLTVDNGKITRIEAAAGLAAVEATLREGGDAALRFREFGMGFHPKLTPAKRSNVLPYFAYGNGMVRMSLGDNEELGGAVRGGGGYRRWFFFPDATVTVDGKEWTTTVGDTSSRR